jgi:hypothetical protein
MNRLEVNISCGDLLLVDSSWWDFEGLLNPSVKRLNPLDPQGLANFLDDFPNAISGPLVCVSNTLGGVRTEIVDCDVASTEHQNYL